jgi:hypothetical protein
VKTLLSHPSISKNQQLVAALLQTSKSLEAALDDCVAGTLPIKLHVTRQSSVQGFGQWLPKHAGMVQPLEVHVTTGSSISIEAPLGPAAAIALAAPALAARAHAEAYAGLDWWGGEGLYYYHNPNQPAPGVVVYEPVSCPVAVHHSERYMCSRLQEATAVALADAMDEAAAYDELQLQSFTLSGIGGSSWQRISRLGLLRHLPAAALTSLCLDAHSTSFSDIVQAVTGLSLLRSLRLASDQPDVDAATFQPLAALQQLTQLHISSITPSQLQGLPSGLEQLHLRVDLSCNQSIVPEAQQLASWLPLHSSILRTLKVVISRGEVDYHEWREVHAVLAAAFVEAAAAIAVPGAAATAEAAGAPFSAGSSGLQLQSVGLEWGELRMPYGPCYGSAAGLQCPLQHLAADSITQLIYRAEGRYVHEGEADMQVPSDEFSALCGFTALRSLRLDQSTLYGVLVDRPALLQVQLLNSLQQLTRLQLERVGRQQLRLLELPQLRELRVSFDLEDTSPMQLGHITSLRKLWVEDKAGVLRPSDQLPPNLRALFWDGRTDDRDWSVKPLLQLSCLEKLQLHTRMHFARASASAASLAQLSSLSSLQSVEVVYDWVESVSDAEAAATAAAGAAAAVEASAAAWRLLPLTALTWSHQCIPVAALLTACPLLQGLSRLELISHRAHCEPLQLAPAALVALLQRMAGLQQLWLNCCLASKVPGPLGVGYHDGWRDATFKYAESVCSLVRTICGLPALETASVTLVVQLDRTSVERLRAQLQQQLPIRSPTSYAVELHFELEGHKLFITF